MSAAFDLGGKRLLIFVVAYNAERTIASVLDRIPAALRVPGVEVLVIDDSSPDATFRAGLRYTDEHPALPVRVLRTPENQGYGGNQKLGYGYAIAQGFDYVALLHGDGQYAPERLPELLGPLVAGEADAVFGSRMMVRGAALRGRMPLYKYVGNRILSGFQNLVLGTAFTEFHSGYRVYSVAALKRVPFERNTGDFHFDTEIILQFLRAKLRIAEVPIPTYYGDEICHVDGLRYAWDVAVATLRFRIHGLNLLYDRKYDLGPDAVRYPVKLGYTSSHSLALEAVAPGSRVLDLGCGPGLIARELAARGCRVTAVDRGVQQGTRDGVEFVDWDLEKGMPPIDVSGFDEILLLDVVEHLREPERFLEQLRSAARSRRPAVVFTTGNIGFAVTRFALLLGQFNYGTRGILDRTHTRLFTFASARRLFVEAGYRVLETRGVPAPFPEALGGGGLGRVLVALNEMALLVLRGLFSYQIFMRVRALPTLHELLGETERVSAAAAEAHRSAVPEPGADR